MVPRAVLEELVREENANGVYRTRIAARILERELIGDDDVHSFSSHSLWSLCAAPTTHNEHT